MIPRPARLLAIAALCAACAAPAPAQQQKAREATIGGGSGSGSGPVLTREQLRQCLVEQDAIAQARPAMVAEGKALDDEKAQIRQDGDALAQALQALDRQNAEAVQAHVAKAQAHDARIEAFNAKLPAFNDRAAAFQRREAAWKSGCADRRYREDDLILLQARKQVPAARP